MTNPSVKPGEPRLQEWTGPKGINRVDLTTLHDIANQARVLGERKLDNGTELIGHAPHVAPEAWLHLLFAPLGDAEIEDLEQSLLFPLPADYAEFLKIHNGISLFLGDVWLGGRRTSYARTGDAARQPFSLVSTNQEHGITAESQEMIIGGEQRIGATFRLGFDDGKVRKYKPRGRKPICVWESLEDMLASEAVRLATCFDASGRRLS